MVTGNNEFQQPGDKGRDAGDRSAGHFQEETQSRGLGAVSYDSAKAAFANVTKDGLMSVGDDPKGFYEKTANLAAQSPEGIRATIAKNDAAAEAIRTYMGCINLKIENVLNAQKVQEDFERANRKG
jgi:hypothetical protein